MRRSAGILLWKKENNEYFVLLTHFGGPYWENNDAGAWSVQKGLVEEKEKIYEAAKRESFEETNLPISSNISYLATKKVSKKKLVIMFESYFDGDISSFQSNYFKLEWPIKSGIYQEFPEMDKIKWFSIQEAKKFIHPTQVFFIERLERKIIENNLDGKTIIPFVTNAGWLGRTFNEIKKLCPNSNIQNEMNVVFESYSDKLKTDEKEIDNFIKVLEKIN